MRLVRRFSQVPVESEIKRLEFGNSAAFLYGIKRYSGLHASFLWDMMKAVKPKCVVTQISPDQPYFIKTQKDFYQTWQKFLQTGEGDFLANPRPQSLQEVILNSQKLSEFYIGAVLNSPQEIYSSANIAYSKVVKHDSEDPKDTDLMKPDGFLTSLGWANHNSDVNECAVLGDMPEIIYREMIARQMSVYEMRELYKIKVDEMKSENEYFDGRFLFKEVFIQPKVNYMAELIKQTCLSYKNVLVVLEFDFLELLSEAWKSLETQVKPLSSLLEIPEMSKNKPFVDFVENHVLLDFILGNFLKKNFIDFGVFPYSGQGAIGADEEFYNQAMTAWDYFYDKHLKEQSFVLQKEKPRKFRKKKPSKQ